MKSVVNIYVSKFGFPPIISIQEGYYPFDAVMEQGVCLSWPKKVSLLCAS